MEISKISILPNIIRLTKFQREEYAKIWFDLAKLCVASFVIKIFEPGSNSEIIHSLFTIFVGCQTRIEMSPPAKLKFPPWMV